MNVQKTPNGWTKQTRKRHICLRKLWVFSYHLNGQSAWDSSSSNLEFPPKKGKFCNIFVCENTVTVKYSIYRFYENDIINLRSLRHLAVFCTGQRLCETLKCLWCFLEKQSSSKEFFWKITVSLRFRNVHILLFF